MFSYDEFESIIHDTFDWTKNKIVGNDTFALTVKGGHGKYGSIDDILRMTEEQEAKERRFWEEQEQAKREEEAKLKESENEDM